MGEPFLFFGIKPPPPEARAIDAVRTAFGLDRSYGIERLHITVHALGPERLLGARGVAAAQAAAGSIDHPPFRVVFNRVEHGLLVGSEPIRGLLRFERVLTASLLRHGWPAERRASFRPHVTLVYGGAPGRHDIDGISWLVEDFALIESLQGEGRHREVKRWRLRG